MRFLLLLASTILCQSAMAIPPQGGPDVYSGLIDNKAYQALVEGIRDSELDLAVQQMNQWDLSDQLVVNCAGYSRSAAIFAVHAIDRKTRKVRETNYFGTEGDPEKIKQCQLNLP